MAIDRQEFNLELIVSKPTWKQILLELIEYNRIDPWNINIIEIADAFLNKIRQMEKLDLLIPANIMLAASILLRYKSSYIRFEEPPELVLQPNDENDYGIENVAQLELAARIPPKRQITVDELIQEMEKIIKYDNSDRLLKQNIGIQEFVDLKLERFDIEKNMGEILEKIKTNVDGDGWTIFSRIVDKNNKRDVVYSLISILHLTQKQVIDIKQDEFFGEIFIQHLNGHKIKGEEKENIKEDTKEKIID